MLFALFPVACILIAIFVVPCTEAISLTLVIHAFVELPVGMLKNTDAFFRPHVPLAIICVAIFPVILA